MLTIQVFPRPSGRSLRDWLDSFGLLPPGSEIAAVQLPGAREGLRVALRQQLAPNEFLYFTTDQYVYGLIPLGPEGKKMLTSFRLISDALTALVGPLNSEGPSATIYHSICGVRGKRHSLAKVAGASVAPATAICRGSAVAGPTGSIELSSGMNPPARLSGMELPRR